MALTITPVNPGSGGANIVTDAQSSGAQLPMSGLAVSPDGVADAVRITGLNPLPSSLAVSSDGFASPSAITGSSRGTPGSPLPVADANSASLQGSIDELNLNVRALVRGLSMILDVDLIELVSQQ